MKEEKISIKLEKKQEIKDDIELKGFEIAEELDIKEGHFIKLHPREDLGLNEEQTTLLYNIKVLQDKNLL